MRHDNDTALDIYLTGLRNAHALENEALSIMQPQISRLEHYPELLARLKEHVRETETQIKRLETILKEFDEGSSTIKDVGGRIMGGLAALGHSMAGDEVLKNTLANYAFENYEIAAYKSLIALADATKQSAHVKLLEQSLGEEIAMASFIENHIEDTTLKFLRLSEAGRTAKV